MEVLHDPWLRYVTFFNVVNVTFIVTCQPSGKNLDEGFLTQPITAYHLCPALPLLLQRPCHPFQSVADQHRSKQIFSDSCLSLLTWKLQNESNHSGFCSIKMHQNALIVSELHDYKANAEPEPLSHLCRMSFTSKGTTGEAALGRNLGCAGFCNSGTWVFKVWTKAKCGVLEIAASKGDDCTPTKTACSGSRTNASELWYRKSSQACCPLCETQSVLRQVVCR